MFNESPNESTDEYTIKLFKTLTKGMIQRLYKFYAHDFEMFDYDYLPYFNVGKE